MSDKVRVRFGKSASDTATLLLAAVEEKEMDANVVQVSSLGGFVVPVEIAKQAGLDYEDLDEADGSKYNEAQVEEAENTPLEGPNGPIESEEAPKPAKKTAAKKTTARKTTAKKATSTKGK
jgi:hypothetical protein